MALPKGYIEKGEVPSETAVRELLEETGAHVPAEALHYVAIMPTAYVLPDELVLKVILFYASDASRDLKIDPARARWVPMREIPVTEFVDGYPRHAARTGIPACA